MCIRDRDNPLSYDQLDGEWRQWYDIAHRFEKKVPAQDRGDVRHNIILELALARRRDGDKPFSEAMMCRVASVTVAHYWRAQYKHTNGLECGSCSKAQRRKCREDWLYRECPKAIRIESLDKPITDSEGNITELGELIADDKAIDLDQWLDSKTFLLGCPQKLIDIAHKIRNGDNLTATDSQYLWRYRKRQQKTLPMM